MDSFGGTETGIDPDAGYFNISNGVVTCENYYKVYIVLKPELSHAITLSEERLRCRLRSSD